MAPAALLLLMAVHAEDPRFSLVLPGLSNHTFDRPGVLRLPLDCIDKLEFRLPPPSARRAVVKGPAKVNDQTLEPDWARAGTSLVVSASIDRFEQPWQRSGSNRLSIEPQDQPQYGQSWSLRDRGAAPFSSIVMAHPDGRTLDLQIDAPGEGITVERDLSEKATEIRGSVRRGAAVRVNNIAVPCRTEGDRCRFQAAVTVTRTTLDVPVVAESGQDEYHAILIPVFWAGAVGGNCR